MSEDRAMAAPELFDAVGAGYDEVFGQRAVAETAVRQLLGSLPPEARVLDIGSGTGRPVADALAAAGHRVTGLDVSAVMVELARSRVPQAEFVQADVREWQSEPESWDAVCAFFSFLQLPRADTEAVLADIARWLVPGGQLVLVTVPMDVEGLRVPFLGHHIEVTSFAEPDLVDRVRASGLDVTGTRSEVFDEPGAEPEEHLLITARKS
ncbi:methyltransferase domain-containing protein [Amycolatopsis sp. NBC_00345]|uniref:class I SAM-dependent methyltransferase n=1 Tax=Amycolatopsis sp. NBC_00345 TaxID=2975955 RepID=UPI002E256E6A